MKMQRNASRQSPQRRSHGLGPWIAERDGNVSIEMAFLVTFLLVLVMGAYDFGRLAMEQSGVTQAARAGAQYAVLDQANATDIDGMRQAAREEAEDPTLEVYPDWFCRCPGGAKTPDCTTNCADGNFPPMYVEVYVEDSLDMLFDYPGLPGTDTYTMTSTSTMRVR